MNKWTKYIFCPHTLKKHPQPPQVLQTPGLILFLKLVHLKSQ